jgi:predicted RNase H-like nuclease (RuvC/YqgF family)
MHQPIDSARRDAKHRCIEHASGFFGVDNCPFDAATERPKAQWSDSLKVGQWGKWLPASFLAVVLATLAPPLLADEIGRAPAKSARLAQAAMAPQKPEAADGGDLHDEDRAGRELAAARRDLDEKTEILAREFAGTMRDLDALFNVLNKTFDPSTHAGQTANERVAELQQSLQQEHNRASQLEQDLAAARRDVELHTSLASKAEEAAQLKQAAEKGSAELKQSLQQERDKSAALAQELSNARAAIYAYDAQARQARDQEAKLTQAAENVAQLKQSLQQERERTGRLEQNLTAARRDLEKQTALATKAAAEASQKKTPDSGSSDLRKSLRQEHDRTSRLEQDLAASRRDVEAQMALVTKAVAEAKELRTAATGTADLRKSLQQERDRATQLERDLALARSNTSMPSSAQQQANATKPVAAKPIAVPDVQPKPVDVAEAEIARLMAQARELLGRGDIGSARSVLERAVDMDSAEASFTLAESYDPLILSKWGTYGTHGDASRAIDLYARALAGGIEEAKERSNALQR